jgi:hypothetical protein
VLNSIWSSQKEEEKDITINEKIYHVECTIKYLHSYARFVLDNSFTSLLISNSSKKSSKSITNKELIRIFCEIMSEWWFWNNQKEEEHFFEDVNSMY